MSVLDETFDGRRPHYNPQPGAVPGMIGATCLCVARRQVQTFGDPVHWHSHIHALVSEGVFLPDVSACGDAQANGSFVPLPKLATDP
ncbi:MAG: hypothetical protein AAB676_21025 [Verrucomicrobiota bacterium]